MSPKHHWNHLEVCQKCCNSLKTIQYDWPVSFVATRSSLGFSRIVQSLTKVFWVPWKKNAASTCKHRFWPEARTDLVFKGTSKKIQGKVGSGFSFPWFPVYPGKNHFKVRLWTLGTKEIHSSTKDDHARRFFPKPRGMMVLSIHMPHRGKNAKFQQNKTWVVF